MIDSILERELYVVSKRVSEPTTWNLQTSSSLVSLIKARAILIAWLNEWMFFRVSGVGEDLIDGESSRLEAPLIVSYDST